MTTATTPAPVPPQESGPTSTSSPFTRVLGVLCLVGVVFLLLFGLVWSAPDVVQGDSVRIMYVHVPVAIVAFLAFFVTALGSGLYLWRKSQFWDLVAGASAEIGVVFTALCLVTGMLWGRPTWGVYWVWDARLTTTALLLVLFLGYLAVRRLPADPDVRAKRAAIAGLIAFVDVPIVHYSTVWWRTLHQGPTITRLDPTIDGLMLFSLMLGMVVFLGIYLWLLVHRFRVAYLESQLEDRGLDVALAERRAEAGPAVVGAAPAVSPALATGDER
ncbi:MAG: cytochrome c biogenesis protein CcsA [Acidimicrobiales bacterium]|nr:cytochrome c biogenesis protein CcsA [Acidimicrobiales bacterium]MCB9373079.1 cytochrome c biogenesis protein CcsA [Microthrixaceae bacterium]